MASVRLDGGDRLVEPDRADDLAIDRRRVDEAGVPGQVDLRIEFAHRRDGVDIDLAGGALPGQLGLDHGVVQLARRTVDRSAHRLDRVEQPLPAGPHPLELLASLVPTPRHVGQDPLPHRSGFGDHPATVVPSLGPVLVRIPSGLLAQRLRLIPDAGRIRLGIGQEPGGLGLRRPGPLVEQRFGLAAQLDRLGLGLGDGRRGLLLGVGLQHRGRASGGFEDTRRLHAEQLGEAVFVELLVPHRRRLGELALELRDLVVEVTLPLLQRAELGGDPGQEPAHLRRIEAAEGVAELRPRHPLGRQR